MVLVINYEGSLGHTIQLGHFNYPKVQSMSAPCGMPYDVRMMSVTHQKYVYIFCNMMVLSWTQRDGLKGHLHHQKKINFLFFFQPIFFYLMHIYHSSSCCVFWHITIVVNIPIFSCYQAALRTLLSICLSIRPSVCPSHLFDNVPVIIWSGNFQTLLPLTEVMSMQKVKVRGQKSRSQRLRPHLAVSGL